MSNNVQLEAYTTDSETSFNEQYSYKTGNILSKKNLKGIFSADVTSDYSAISKSADISLVRSKDTSESLYLGAQARLLSDEHEDVFGFVTSSEFSEIEQKIHLAGFDVLLDQKSSFDFLQTPISTILEEVIKAAGLVPVVDFHDLQEISIEFHTTSETSNMTSVQPGEWGNLAKEIIQDRQSSYGQAEAIWKYMHDKFKYQFYFGHKKSPQSFVSDRGGNCVDHAIIYYLLASSLNLRVGFVRSSGCYGAHVYNGILIDNIMYTADTSIKSIPAFNRTKCNYPRATKENTEYNWNIWGKDIK